LKALLLLMFTAEMEKKRRCIFGVVVVVNEGQLKG
jgi:hypothetical protein